jgi:hypothetical protein
VNAEEETYCGEFQHIYWFRTFLVCFAIENVVY